MKTIQELMELVNQTIIANASIDKVSSSDMFIRYSPHVNRISMQFYLTGWKQNMDSANIDSCDVSLHSQDDIQEAYWFIHNRKKHIF